VASYTQGKLSQITLCYYSDWDLPWELIYSKASVDAEMQILYNATFIIKIINDIL